jgi:DNA repair protein RecO
VYHKHHTKGIVVGNRADGSDNLRAYVFTESFGLINTRVQGARNLRSKLRPGVQNFSLGEFSLVHGKTGWKVVSVRPEKNLFEIFKNFPEKLAIVCNILNLIKKLVDEEKTSHTTSTSLFNIVEKFFVFLEKAKESEIALAECLTLVRILHCLGYMRHDPELSVPISSSEIQISDLESIAPRRSQMVALINESLKAT